MSSRLRCLALVVFCLMLGGRDVSAADRPVPLSQRGVDRLSPSFGPALLGTVLRKSPRGEVVMAVRRGWLKEADPKRLTRLDEELAESSPRAWRRLIERIDAWRGTLKPGDPLLALLELERKRVVQSLKSFDADGVVPPTRFVLLTIPAREISALTLQAPNRKQTALVAWVEGLEDVETRSAEDLAAELKESGIDPATAGAESLWRELPVVSDDERTWLVRRAVKASGLSEPLHFQGTAGILLAVNGKNPGGGLDEPIDPKVLGDLMRQVLGGELGGDIGKLLEQLGGRRGGSRPGQPGRSEQSSLATVASRAETAGRDAVRVTRFRHDLAGRKTTVSSEFLVRVAQGEWVVAWQGSETVTVRDRPEARKRIEKDARVQKLLRLAKALGVKGGDKAIQTALQFGAATQDGQQRLDARFLRYRDRYSYRLDGPHLWWSEAIRIKDAKTP